MPNTNDDLNISNNDAAKAYEQDISNRTGIPEELVEEGVKSVAEEAGITEAEAAAEIDSELAEAQDDVLDNDDADDNDDFGGDFNSENFGDDD